MNRTPEQQYFFQRMQEGGEAAVGPSRVIEELPTNATIMAMYEHFGSEEAVRRELDASAAREKLLEEQQVMTDGLSDNTGRQLPSPAIQKYGPATGVQLENLLMENPGVDELTALRALVDSGAIDPRAIEIFMANRNTGAGETPPVYEDVPAYQGQPTENVEPPNAYFMDRLRN
tara:strand:- start:736 stop:1257 length:522 start_codon:yes stop_codon:yes gene_type:complete